MRFLIFLAIFTIDIANASVFIVSRPTASVYSQPDVKSLPVGTLKKGTRIRVVNESNNGFFQFSTKSGRALWIALSDVAPQIDLTSEVGEKTSRWNFDLGLASGSRNGRGYSEILLGLNYFLSPSWILRNAAFYRYISGGDSFFGLDSSLRYLWSGRTTRFAYQLYGGPGVRLPSEGLVRPFFEGGIVGVLGGFTLGLGFKTILEEDTQLMIMLAGGGQL